MDTSFRYDINALRALAVLGVVAYHFDLGGLSGGFVGVDVFFVVSGFLMTRIIGGRLASDRFSLLGFYGARTRRIVPALAVLVMAAGFAGTLALNPLRLAVLAQDCVSSLLFFSNVLYLNQGGYFAAAANQNWLLHTWSLSLEWQFYLVFPLLLMGLKRVGLGRRGTCAVLAVLLVLSFAKTVASHFTGGGTQDAAFYLLPARAWEFLVGGLCAFAPVQGIASARWRPLAHYAGAAMILAAMVRLAASDGWPSAWALLPVLGTALVLLADRQSEAWARLPATRSIGLWSYSIYLWHWPIAAALSYFALRSLPVRLVGIAASVGIAALSYRYVEARASAFLWENRRRLVTLGAPAFALPLLLAFFTSATSGLEVVRYAFRPELRTELADYRAAIKDWRFPHSCDAKTYDSTGFATCSFGDPKARDVLVVGDSFAEQLTPRYTGLLRGTSRGITFVTRGGCPLLPGIDRQITGANCARWSEAAYAYAESHDFKRVIFIGSWLSYSQGSLCLLDQPGCGDDLTQKAFNAALDTGFDRMAERWQRLRRQGKDIVVLDVMPYGGGDPAVLYQKAIEGHPQRTVSVSLTQLNKARSEMTVRLARIAPRAGATLVDPAGSLCHRGMCPIVENGRTLFKDEDHLRSSVMRDGRFAFLDAYLLWQPAGQSVQQAAN